MSKKEKILILVKTYPHRSTKYGEIVCTAGIRSDGTWVRIFPVPFRLYTNEQQFSKYQWVECPAYKAKDPRPESYHIDLDQQLILGDKIGTQGNWERRRKAILEKARVYTKFSELREMISQNAGSLAIFRPKKIKLRCEAAQCDDDPPSAVSPEMMQMDLFHENDWRNEFKRVEPIPYDFKYEVIDADGEKATHKILDWELGSLFYWEKQRLGSEEKARDSVKKKYGVDFLNTDKYDLYLYMGTMLQFQQRKMPNPWTIIGVAPFPRMNAVQTEFDF